MSQPSSTGAVRHFTATQTSASSPTAPSQLPSTTVDRFYSINRFIEPSQYLPPHHPDQNLRGPMGYAPLSVRDAEERARRTIAGVDAVLDAPLTTDHSHSQ